MAPKTTSPQSTTIVARMAHVRDASPKIRTTARALQATSPTLSRIRSTSGSCCFARTMTTPMRSRTTSAAKRTLARDLNRSRSRVGRTFSDIVGSWAEIIRF
jgi:hypothetical protein